MCLVLQRLNQRVEAKSDLFIIELLSPLSHLYSTHLPILAAIMLFHVLPQQYNPALIAEWSKALPLNAPFPVAHSQILVRACEKVPSDLWLDEGFHLGALVSSTTYNYSLLSPHMPEKVTIIAHFNELPKLKFYITDL